MTYSGTLAILPILVFENSEEYMNMVKNKSLMERKL